jgi:hypothetical protein
VRSSTKKVKSGKTSLNIDSECCRTAREKLVVKDKDGMSEYTGVRIVTAKYVFANPSEISLTLYRPAHPNTDSS